MDLLKKITEELEPLGGELLTDQLLRLRRVPESAPPARPRHGAAAGKAKAPPRAESVRVAALKPPAEIEPQAESADDTDTGKLRAEVQAFLNRDEAEGTDEGEVQEFLNDRKGFDPSELE